jgi:hypothetical protein
MELSFVVSEVPESMAITLARNFKPVPNTHTKLDGSGH